MDLVEIRKKAGKKRNKPAPAAETSASEAVKAEAAPPASPAESAEQSPRAAKEPGTRATANKPVKATEPEAVEEETPVPVPVTPKAKSKPTKKAPVEEIDPIEALFSFRIEGDLATEETYLQALMGKDESVDSQQQQWLTFSLGSEEYALDIESISEIIKPREVTDIPRVPAFIRGIISLRGIIVPIFDLKGRLKLGAVDDKHSARIIVCQLGERIAGFLVDSINQVVNIPLSRIEPPPTVLSGVDRDFVEGVGRVDGRLLILLDLSHVINAELLH